LEKHKFETTTNTDGGFNLLFVKPGRYRIFITPAEDRMGRPSLRPLAGFEEIEVWLGVQTQDIWIKSIP
jgi:hypothetical protein